MTHATGMKLASGEFVLIAGMVYSIPFTIKKPLITLFNYCKKDIGKKVSSVYFVELILFVMYGSCPSGKLNCEGALGLLPAATYIFLSCTCPCVCS